MFIKLQYLKTLSTIKKVFSTGQKKSLLKSWCFSKSHYLYQELLKFPNLIQNQNHLFKLDILFHEIKFIRSRTEGALK
ncbi:hypothetical protein DHB64_01525 [Antarcticibacterium sp. W02-3]|nr:hypothetical protein [Antarcticibacterium sp. W02-3]